MIFTSEQWLEIGAIVFGNLMVFGALVFAINRIFKAMAKIARQERAIEYDARVKVALMEFDQHKERVERNIRKGAKQTEGKIV